MKELDYLLEKKFEQYCLDNDIDYHSFDNNGRCIDDFDKELFILEDYKKKKKVVIGGEPLKPIFRVTEDKIEDLRKTA